MVMSSSHLSHRPNRVPITVMAAVFISFCKYESPCPNSDFKHGDGRPYQATASPPALPLCTSNPPDSSGPRCHNEIRHCFQPCVKCDILCLLVSRVNASTCVCEELTRRSRRTPPCLWDTSCSGQHQSSAGSLGQQSGLCTHTQINTQPIQRETRFREVLRQRPASSRLLHGVLRKVCKANHPLITFEGDFHQQSSLVPEFPP